MKKKLFITAAVLVLIPALFFAGRTIYPSLEPWLYELNEQRLDRKGEVWRAQALDWMDEQIEACADEEDYYDPDSGRVVIRSLQTLEAIRSYIEHSEYIRDESRFSVPTSPMPGVKINGADVGPRGYFDMSDIIGKFVVIYYTQEDSLAFGDYLDEFIKDEPWFNP